MGGGGKTELSRAEELQEIFTQTLRPPGGDSRTAPASVWPGRSASLPKRSVQKGGERATVQWGT